MARLRRENYVHYHCRHIEGFDFGYLQDRVARAGTQVLTMPSVTGPLAATVPFLPHDWQVAQAATDKPVKMTVPGPLTISDTVADDYYNDRKAFGRALAEVLNVEIKALASAGCTVIQVDEPVFAREADLALDYGIENLERCFHGLDASVTRVVHACCGYPSGSIERISPRRRRRATTAWRRLLIRRIFTRFPLKMPTGTTISPCWSSSNRRL